MLGIKKGFSKVMTSWEVRLYSLGKLPTVKLCTVKPVYNEHLIGYFSAKGHLDELQKAEAISKSKLVPSVFIKTHYWINHR